MAATTLLFEVLLVLGVILAIAYGALVVVYLRRVPSAPWMAPGARSAVEPEIDDPSLDQPTYWSRGEPFEEGWQGSRGYDRTSTIYGSSGAPWPRENWTDRLIIPVFSPLRPSRFSDRRYWRAYLPKILAVWLVLFIGVPVVAAMVNAAHVGKTSTFVPTALQRQAPSSATAFSRPIDCTSATRPEGAEAPLSPMTITYADDGDVFSVRPDHEVDVRYIYGSPVVSPGTPLCLDRANSTPGHAVFFTVGQSGSGYLYFPQPNGARAVKIDLVAGVVLVDLLLLVVALVALVVDIMLTRKLRMRVMSPRLWRRDDRLRAGALTAKVRDP